MEPRFSIYPHVLSLSHDANRCLRILPHISTTKQLDDILRVQFSVHHSPFYPSFSLSSSPTRIVLFQNAPHFDLVFLQQLPIHRQRAMAAVAHIHAALRQAVAPCDRMRRELERRQDGPKAANDVHGDGLRGIEDVLNGREIEIGGLVRREAAKKQRVREIGALEMRRAVLRSELQPENGREDERKGREVHAASSAVEKRENGADEPHIVVLGKPTRDDGGAVRVESTENDVDVGDERGDGDHDAFGERCAARSVLEEAEMVAGEVESGLVWHESKRKRENRRERRGGKTFPESG